MCKGNCVCGTVLLFSVFSRVLSFSSYVNSCSPIMIGTSRDARPCFAFRLLCFLRLMLARSVGVQLACDTRYRVLVTLCGVLL